MTSAAKISLRLAFFLAISLQAQPGPTDNPAQSPTRKPCAARRPPPPAPETRGGARRAEAKSTHRGGQTLPGSRRPHPASPGGQAVGGCGQEGGGDGLGLGVGTTLARQAMAAGDVIEATTQVEWRSRWIPTTRDLRRLKAEINQRAIEQAGRVPSPETIKKIPTLKSRRWTSPPACRMPSSFTKWANTTRRR